MAFIHNYYVYLITNKNKTALYTGMTNNLERRLIEHETGINDGFSKKYNCHYLVYFEHYTDVNQAIAREKQIKKWRREKKNNLINRVNPQWRFLNDEIKNEG